PLTGTVQVVGSAMMDDFSHLDLEVGAGPSPTIWTKITDGRTAGVDHALLGVWSTAGWPPGRYTLRLSVYDGFGNVIQRSSPATVGPPPPPTPPSPRGPSVPPHPPPLFGAPPTPTVVTPRLPPPPSPGPAPRAVTPQPLITPTPTPRRR